MDSLALVEMTGVRNLKHPCLVPVVRLLTGEWRRGRIDGQRRFRQTREAPAMRGVCVRRLWWCVPAVVLAVADGCLTLWGQPEAYWSGGFRAINEGNPLAAWLLGVHPLAFASAGVPYLLLVIAAVMALPRWWAVAVAKAIAPAHAFGVSVWCGLCPPPAFLPVCSAALTHPYPGSGGRGA